ncbi:hypothetical protein BDF20DRAFT_839814 [Mycotypha africana]|uniref:uncharacterized protein n=1 Tax=Mycotypha africana TaxID=64632 RepID=UPI0022FFC883|nr:uncharacterized protein BDF20DRAFT_839814 [Mycotypha africana]KAI8967986.1 hypothetical protein BDF20DRAFT_839814 [Mycotypha africana]
MFKLSDDCLELIFIACEGCPLTLCTLTQVCRQWYAIAQRHSIWRRVTFSNPNKHAAYTRFLTSKFNKERLNQVKTVSISKPNESRHAHLRPLPITSMPQLRHLHTFNLCLAEIDCLSRQILEVGSKLQSISCSHIETWCDTRRFSFDLIQRHAHLNHVLFQFLDDGHSGFASIHNMLTSYNATIKSSLHSMVITSIRDNEMSNQKQVIRFLEEVEKDRDDVFTQADIERIEQKQQGLINSWYDLERGLLDKYSFFASLENMSHLEFGFCYAWTSKIWKDVFCKVLHQCPQLSSLSLHGWDQLGKLEKVGCHCSAIQPIRIEAELAITECFEAIPQLKSLQLVDFSIGFGLLKAAHHLSKSIEHLEIAFSGSFTRYFTEPADLWHLLGPVKDFTTIVFTGTSLLSSACSAEQQQTKEVVLRLHSSLQNEMKRNQFFFDEPLKETIEEALTGRNVQIKLVDFSNTN